MRIYVWLFHPSAVPPLFHLSPVKLTVVYGSNITLTCSVSSFPALTSLTWLHRPNNDHRSHAITPTLTKQLTPRAASSLLHNWTITLELSHFAKGDSGYYHCVATYAQQPQCNATRTVYIDSVSVGYSADTAMGGAHSGSIGNIAPLISSGVVAGGIAVAMATYMLIRSSRRKRRASISAALTGEGKWYCALACFVISKSAWTYAHS